MIIIDFETKSFCCLKTYGTSKYSNHHSTDILCMSYVIGEGEVKTWLPEEPFPIELRQEIENGTYVYAHNMTFDYLIWKNVGEKRYSFPELKIEQVMCSMAVCQYKNIPASLKNAAKFLGLKEQKYDGGADLILTYSIPYKPRLLAEKALIHNMSKEEYAQKVAEGVVKFNEMDKYAKKDMIHYCEQDIRTTKEVLSKIGDIPEFYKKLYQIVFKRNMIGLNIDAELSCKIASVYEQYLTSVKEEFTSLVGDINHTQNVALAKKLTNMFNIKIEGLSKKHIGSVLRMPYIPDRLRKILELKQILAFTAYKKAQKAVDKLDEDGKLRNFLVPFGADSGRFTAKGIQVQNMVKLNGEELGNDVIDKIILSVKKDDYEEFVKDGFKSTQILHPTRSIIVPDSSGKIVVMSDYKSVELRIAYWIADDLVSLKQSYDGYDMYKKAASSIFSIPIEKVEKKHRQIGKNAVLGANYGMGWQKFMFSYLRPNGGMVHYTEEEVCSFIGSENYDNCLSQIHKQLHSIEMAEKLKEYKETVEFAESDFVFSKFIVDNYRDSNKHIIGMWDKLLNSIETSFYNPGKPIKCGRVVYMFNGVTMVCRLPSGRFIYYHGFTNISDTEIPDFRYRKRYYEKTKEKKDGKHQKSDDGEIKGYEKLYGGRLFQNICQSVAADVAMQAIVNLSKDADYEFMLMVHDEIVAQVDPRWYDKDTFESYLLDMPPCYDGLLLNTDTMTYTRYRA